MKGSFSSYFPMCSSIIKIDTVTPGAYLISQQIIVDVSITNIDFFHIGDIDIMTPLSSVSFSGTSSLLQLAKMNGIINKINRYLIFFILLQYERNPIYPKFD